MKVLKLILLSFFIFSCSRSSEDESMNSNNFITVKNIEVIENGFDYSTSVINSQIDFSYINNKLSTVNNGKYTMKFNYSNNKLI